MTGTAATEESEFREIYNLDVIEIPTNKPVIRQDHEDFVYTTMRGKYNAVIDQIVECHKKGQPVLVGTTSIEKSELHQPDARPARASGTPSSTPNSTSVRRRLSPRPVSSAPSPSPPIWPAAAPTSCSAATPNSWPSTI